MNSQDYISSGVLELYALDMLSAEERLEVVTMLQKHPEVAAELEKIEITLEEYASGFSKAPSHNLKSKIISSLDDTPVVTMNRRSSIYQFIAVAASILFIISLGINFYQVNQLKKTEEKLNNMIAEKTYLAEESSQFKAKYKETKNQVDLFQNPDIQNIVIKGSELSPNSYAFISFNKSDKSVAISGINLPENGEEYQYQLWALVDGNPVDLGVFDSSDSLKMLTKTVDSPDAFAVTLQDRGGNEKPNLEKLYLIGSV